METFYECPYCGTEYEIPSDLAHCILRCEKKTKEAKKDARYKEVIDAYENFEKLKSKYVEDYGSFTFKHTKGNIDPRDWAFRQIGLF